MNKKSRQFAIKQIILDNIVANQDELRRLLLGEGHEVTQATLSRDLKEMGVARTHTQEGVRYVLPQHSEDQRLTTLLSYEIDSIAANEAVVVIKTLPGRAQGVADVIDTLSHPDILGTIAGDNTLFIAPVSTARIESLITDLRTLVAEGRARRAAGRDGLEP